MEWLNGLSIICGLGSFYIGKWAQRDEDKRNLKSLEKRKREVMFDFETTRSYKYTWMCLDKDCNFSVSGDSRSSVFTLIDSHKTYHDTIKD